MSDAMVVMSVEEATMQAARWNVAFTFETPDGMPASVEPDGTVRITGWPAGAQGSALLRITGQPGAVARSR